jgi:hypothetical protein
VLVLSANAVLQCSHVNGLVTIATSQAFVTVTEPASRDRRVQRASVLLIEPDPEDRPIVGCPNINVGIFPCTITKRVRTGYSAFVTIGGKPICLATVTGLTNGSPGVFEYAVSAAGQGFIQCRA